MTDYRSLVDHPTWMADGNCVGLPGDVMFPTTPDGERAAVAICHACDVQSHCLAYALELDERFGVWGGLAAYQRSRVRRGQAPGRLRTSGDGSITDPARRSPPTPPKPATTTPPGTTGETAP